MIFVTGGTGMTGARLLYDLALKGLPVTALRRQDSPSEIVDFYFKNSPDLLRHISWVNGDICDIDSLGIIEKNAEVYHCAGLVSFDPADREVLYAVNIRGTENVVNQCLLSGVRKLVHLSSVASLGRNNPDDIYIDEESHWENDGQSSDYSISKYGGEREVWRGIAEGLNAVIVNPSVIIGAGNWDKGSSKMIQKSDEGLLFYTDGISGFVDVNDVSEIMIQLMNSDVSGERFIISSEDMHYKQLFEIIAEELGKRKPGFKAAPWMGNLMWRLEAVKQYISKKPPLITRFTSKTAFEKYRYSNKKITSLLDYKFIPVEESIRNACKIYLESKKTAAAFKMQA